MTIGNDAWATGNPVFKGSSLMFLKPACRFRSLSLSVASTCSPVTTPAWPWLILPRAAGRVCGPDEQLRLRAGSENSHFQTVHGPDAEGQYSSARDMALIGQALIRDVPNEYSIYKEKEFTFNGIRQTNRNGLLWDNSLNVDGIKTGHTDKAGYNGGLRH